MLTLRVFLQCLIILFPIIIAIIWPIESLFLGALSFNGDTAIIQAALNTITKNEKIISLICGVIISIFLLLAIRRMNKEKLFNTGNAYFNHSIVLYWIAAKILGYGILSLIRVPIYLQFKLLFQDLFNQILIDDNVEIVSEIPTIITKNIDIHYNELNLILSDTYEIQERDLPLSIRKLPTVIIRKGSNFNGNRTYNPNFISAIREQTNKYRHQYDIVNIFATTNTNHNKSIIFKCFKNGDRTGFQNIYVYEQGGKDRNYHFFKKHKIK